MKALQLSKGNLGNLFVSQLQYMQWCHVERVASDLEVIEDLGSKPSSANSCVTLDKLYNTSEPQIFLCKVRPTTLLQGCWESQMK